MSQVGHVADIRLRKRPRGLRNMCQQSLLDMLSSHNAWNCVLEVVGQSRSGLRVEGFLEDEELARALSCHFSMDLLCQKMSDR